MDQHSKTTIAIEAYDALLGRIEPEQPLRDAIIYAYTQNFLPLQGGKPNARAAEVYRAIMVDGSDPEVTAIVTKSIAGAFTANERIASKRINLWLEELKKELLNNNKED